MTTATRKITAAVNCTLAIGDLEIDFVAHYAYSPGRPAVRYLRNGDPGYPEEPAEIEIVGADCVDKQIPEEHRPAMVAAFMAMVEIDDGLMASIERAFDDQHDWCDCRDSADD